MKKPAPRPDRRPPVCPGCAPTLAHQRRLPRKLCPECLHELAEKLRRRPAGPLLAANGSAGKWSKPYNHSQQATPPEKPFQRRTPAMDPVDVITRQLRSSVATALAETVAQERIAARAAAIEDVRRAANKLLEEPQDLLLTARQAFVELFRRLAADAPLPSILDSPDRQLDGNPAARTYDSRYAQGHPHHDRQDIAGGPYPQTGFVPAYDRNLSPEEAASAADARAHLPFVGQGVAGRERSKEVQDLDWKVSLTDREEAERLDRLRQNISEAGGDPTAPLSPAPDDTAARIARSEAREEAAKKAAEQADRDREQHKATKTDKSKK